MTIFSTGFVCPIGPITLRASHKGLYEILLCRSPIPGPFLKLTPCLTYWKRVLRAYFQGTIKIFPKWIDLSWASNFQLKVYEAVTQIPYGYTRSYRDIACSIGDKSLARAVGAALRYNRLPIVIPCHRVINKGGQLGGYSAGIALKRYLLKLEALHSRYIIRTNNGDQT
jgi:methylated-DNA-[protein]-cysteine S-methyltransferase